jgi:lipoyl(octanoyl) transferase
VAAEVATEARLIRPSGLVPYGAADQLMHELARKRLGGQIPDTLILLEHPPVYTAGTRWDPAHLRWAEDAMRASGAEFHRVDRGGSVTFHGPGQLVGYPIMDLGHRPDVVGFVRVLEQIVIDACADVGLDGLGRNPVNSGVWAGDRKVCAIGIRVMRARVTLHGFALNCTTDLSWFDAIHPCGLADHGVTSLSELAGRPVAVQDMAGPVAERFAHHFGLDFGAQPFSAPEVDPT